MSQFAFYFNGTRCNGCKTCVMACKDLHDLPPERSYRRVFEYEGSTPWTVDASGCNIPGQLYSYFISVACNHCDDPACVKACPTGASSKDEKTGLVTVDEKLCIGCGSCAQACPYDARVVNDETKKCEKCDGCAERVAAGSVPMCVEACPQRALACGEASDAPKGFERADIAPLPSADVTSPNLFILPAKSAQQSKEATGHVANEPETK